MSIAYHYSLYDGTSETAYKEVKGVLSVVGEELLFEYKVYDMMGSAISTLNKFSILVDHIKRTHYKKGFFQSKLIIEATRMGFMEPLPGSEQGVIRLDIKRANRDEAVGFSSKINLALSERRLKELDD
ncbi:MAG: hypothetical protein FH748_04980 [Balneolaceae bacterium]|nr:hypothetical protein [Balneolaceae bacterium]